MNAAPQASAYRIARPSVGWVLVAILLVSLGVGWLTAARGVSYHLLRRVPLPPLRVLVGWTSEPPPLAAASLTPEMRRHGYNECNPFDFIGLGPYAPYRKVRVGRMAIPQKGGHTKDWGYDVVVHFHGQNALRTTLVQIARGVAFVGIDLGNGSGAYSDEFASRESWPLLRQSIEGALRSQSGHPEAYIRHVALTAWSAGYGAVNEILKHQPDDIDAVVLLDGLHAGWDPARTRHQTVNDVVAGGIAPTIEYARRALRGEKIFIFTYSEIDPITYPSTSLTAQLLLRELGVESVPVQGAVEDFGLISAVDQKGLHLWAYEGNDKPAHCTHLSHIDLAVRDIIEPAWNTPAMDRDVASTPAPKLGSPVSANRSGTGPNAEALRSTSRVGAARSG